MAVRHTSLDFSDFETFVKEARTSLASGAVMIPADRIDGELAPEFKLDLVLPFVGRVGPLKGQVIQRMPQGTAARLPDQGKIQAAVESVWAVVDQVKGFLVDQGDVVLPGQAAPLAEDTVDESALVEDTTPPPDDRHPENHEEYEEVIEEAAPEGLRDGYALPDELTREPDHAGSLEDRSLRDTLVELATDETTGVLTLILPDGSKRFGFWVDGGPVGWRSAPFNVQHTVGGLLVSSGKLEEPQRQASLKLMEEKSIRQCQALVEMELLSQGSIAALLRKQTEFLLQSSLRERKGVWAFHTVEQQLEAFAIKPVSVPRTLYRAMLGFSKNVSSEKVYADLKRRLDTRVQLLPMAEPVLSDFRWAEREERFLRLLRSDPPLRVRKIFSLTPMTKADTAGTLWAFEEMGFLDFGDSDQADVQRRIKRLSGPLLKKARAVQGDNLFDVLEIHWICTRGDVDKAYTALAKRWSRGAFGPVPDELGKALDAIEGRLKEARERLHDDTRRRAYRQELVGDDMVGKCASFLANKGDGFIGKEDRAMALRCYARATELAPAAPEYKVGLDKAQAMKRKFKRR